MPPRDRSPRQRLTREDLPEEFTPETLRRLGMRTLRELAQKNNGVLTPEEQRQFDAALVDVRRATASLVSESMERARRGGPRGLDPAMRRSYQRAQERLAEQVRRVQEGLPELPVGAGPLAPDPAPDPTTEPTTQPTTEPTTEPEQPDDDHHDDVSPSSLAREVEQTSETLDMLERIATLQQTQLEHQESQLLSETRGLFFAFVVSVAVIIAGVAPLVEAEPDDRLPIVVWTVAVTAVAGLVYALVRAVQNRK